MVKTRFPYYKANFDKQWRMHWKAILSTSRQLYYRTNPVLYSVMWRISCCELAVGCCTIFCVKIVLFRLEGVVSCRYVFAYILCFWFILLGASFSLSLTRTLFLFFQWLMPFSRGDALSLATHASVGTTPRWQFHSTLIFNDRCHKPRRRHDSMSPITKPRKIMVSTTS
jgi:hypothetical protein